MYVAVHVVVGSAMEQAPSVEDLRFGDADWLLAVDDRSDLTSGQAVMLDWISRV